eukprot:TRINITY_DN440_c0_g2_i1.p1 TRINITY_DN440_c0_g2~~TRINITY_DN440_c0_g2_i1.p1  ORF type:complete len:100 (+),score=17.85 TRINITY_DN440_c0_g2_i1:87-386(+)
MALFVRRVIFGILFATVLGQAVDGKGERLEDLRKLADTDGDGTTSIEELKAFMKKRMADISDPHVAAQARKLMSAVETLGQYEDKLDAASADTNSKTEL